MSDETGFTPAGLLFGRGVMKAADGDMAAARDLYERAIAMGEVKALVNLGGIEFALNNVETAIRMWEEAAAADEVRAHHNLGMAYAKVGRVEDSRASYERAASAGHTEAMYQMAELCHFDGDIEAEMAWLEGAATAGNMTAMAAAASRRAQLGDYDKAIEWYETAHRAGHLDAHHDLALLYGRIGMREESKRLLLELAHDDDDDDAMSALGLLYFEDGELEEASRWLERSASMNNPKGLNNLGVLRRDQGEHERAEAAFRRAAEFGEVQAAVSMSSYAIEGGDTLSAIRWLRPHWESGDSLVVENVEWILGRQKRWAATDAAMMSDLGVLHLNLGQEEQAEVCLRDAAARGDTVGMRNLGIVLSQTGRTPEAVVWLKRAVEAGDEGASSQLRSLGSKAIADSRPFNREFPAW